MFAVVESAGSQYLVSKGEKIIIPAAIGEVGKTIEFDKVLMLKKNGDVEVGRPYIEGAKVKAVIKKTGKLPKVVIYKFIRRKKYRRKKGHRQHFTEVEITDIIKRR